MNLRVFDDSYVKKIIITYIRIQNKIMKLQIALRSTAGVILIVSRGDIHHIYEKWHNQHLPRFKISII